MPAIVAGLCCISGSAQEYKVKSFELKPEDLTARMGEYSRIDNNATKCAILKVYVADKITGAEGNVCGDIVSKGMEKWIYMTNNSRRLKLNFENHYPLMIEFIDHNFPMLTSQMVYVVKLEEDGAVAVAQTPTPTPAPTTNTVNQPMTANGNETYTVNGVSFEMVKVEGGTFMMGSEDYEETQPVHAEKVATFFIGKTEVTRELWFAIMSNTPNGTRNKYHPVTYVSWDDCQEFIGRLNRLTGRNFRLPTEAEWEYAARGGNKSQKFEYSGSNNLDRVGWYNDNTPYDNDGHQTTQLVTQKLDNELGLYDMSGNVAEWCSDSFSADYSMPRNFSKKVIRGGNFLSGDIPCCVYSRDCKPTDFSSHDIGLRLAL